MRLSELKGIGPKTEELFSKIGVNSVEELKEYYPVHYDSYTEPENIEDCRAGSKCAISVTVTDPVSMYKAGKLTIISLDVRDSTGKIRLVWYNSPFIRSVVKRGSSYVFRGNIVSKKGSLVMEHPEIFKPEQYQSKLSTLNPVYGLTKGLTNNTVVKAIHSAFEATGDVPEYLPEQIAKALDLMGEETAVSYIHFPPDQDSLVRARSRLAFDELLKNIAQEDSDAGNWTMVLMDVNGLKYANDTFGHQAGDVLIVAAGKSIKKAYGLHGNCFRIGGDEFAVVTKAPLDSLFLLYTNLQKSIEEYNKDALYHLSIAVGESRLRSDSGIRKSISDWKMEADLNMYRDKVRYHKSTEVNENQNLKDLITCLISVEEAKDSYTAYHSERVKAYTELLARLLGLSEASVSLITHAAHLHDIGKMGISDNVLGKPGKLTDDEFSIIDGRGYPEGLKGEEIPIGARIIAIADSIDAMTSKRVYRDAMSLDYCRKEIEKNLGVMYDPAIGKVALEHWNEIVDMLLKMQTGRPKVI